jgi:putative ABC transport system permease protein
MGFEARSVLSRVKEARRFFVFMEVLLASVGTVGLVVAGLGILNTLLMTVMERYQEIGIYKAIGASNGDVRILFLTEAAVLGLAGGLGGLLLAKIVCWFLQWGINQYALHQGIEGPTDAFHFPLWLLAGAVFYAVVISVLSGLYPASRAARIDPIHALRGE